MRVRSRKSVLAVASAASLMLVLAACGSGGGTSSSSSSAAPASSSAASSSAPAAPINLGAIVTISGPLAQIGQSHEAGAKLAVAQVNAAGGVNGAKLNLIVKDEKLDPTATVQDVRDLLSSNVKLMFGLTTDSDCLAAAPVVAANDAVLIGTSCQTNLLTTTKFVKNFFEIAPTNYMLSMATARLAAQRFPNVKSWDGIGPDYQFGHEVWTSFQTDLKKIEPSVKFRKTVYVPLTESQFGSYITSLLSGLPSNSAQNNGLFLSTFSATTVGLAKQGKSYNLFGKYKAALNLGGSTPTAEAMGADTPPLYFIYDYYDGAYNNATNTAFVNGYKAANNGATPNAWAYEGYTAVMAYVNAIKQAKSTDPNTLINTLAGMTFDTAKGSLTFRKADHLLQSPVTVWYAVGDKTAPGGFKVTFSEAIPADQVLPPVNVG